ncbi:hypothetical protein [Devosia nitrariae]|uniref:Uncharacterized protein n=1 Tax=Devosia nitrariae TaxID=2071872 RepID=A0ABQ5WB65_9HYPH|nr:hypothetical protein [Devosia nitrariae]GLQ57180.1 hypothetical protein GCM10010862_44390 [Devosia nitrariae]
MPFGIVPFTRDGITAVKHRIRDQCPDIKSSHIDEAIAFGFGFHTYAAMLPVLERVEAVSSLSAQMVPQWVMLRLAQLGYEPTRLQELQGLLWNPPVRLSAEAQARYSDSSQLFRPAPANDG